MSAAARERSIESAPRGAMRDSPRGRPSRVARGRLTWGRPPSPEMQRRHIAWWRNRTSRSSVGVFLRGSGAGRRREAQHLVLGKESRRGGRGSRCGARLARRTSPGSTRLAQSMRSRIPPSERRLRFGDPLTVVRPDLRRLHDPEVSEPVGEGGRAHLDAAGRSRAARRPGRRRARARRAPCRPRARTRPPRSRGAAVRIRGVASRRGEPGPTDSRRSRIAGEPADDVEGGAERDASRPSECDRGWGGSRGSRSSSRGGAPSPPQSVPSAKSTRLAAATAEAEPLDEPPGITVRGGGVERGPVVEVLAGQAVGELVGEGLSREVRAGVEQRLHRRGGGAGRLVGLEPGRVAEPRPVPLDVEDVLRREPKAGERPGSARPGGRRGCRGRTRRPGRRGASSSRFPGSAGFQPASGSGRR